MAADPVLKGLGGASQEDQQPALVLASRGTYFSKGGYKEKRWAVQRFFCFAKKKDRIYRMNKRLK